MVSLLTLFGCENSDNTLGLKNDSNAIGKLELIEGTIQLDSKASLKSIVASYKKDVAGQNKFNNGIRNLQNKGFKPLAPIFEINETEKIQKFILEKKGRSQKVYKSLGITSKSATDEIDLDDNLIADPVLAALLNEDREIVIADSLYKYTEMGLYFCLKIDKQKLYDYLNKLTVTQKRSQITNKVTACEPAPLEAKIKLIAPVTLVSDGINLFIPIAPCDTNPPPASSTPPVVVLPPSPTPTLIKQNLPINWIENQGWFEQIFGTREVDVQDYGDDYRIKVTFWNQNFFIYSSIGCSAKFQKRATFLGIPYWDKSYADKIELGINNINYDYKFNVPQYNNSIEVGI